MGLEYYQIKIRMVFSWLDLIVSAVNILIHDILKRGK